MTFLSENILDNVVNKISEHCDSWLTQFAVVAPEKVMERRKLMRGTKCLIQAVLGIFIKPKLSEKKDIYIFQGLRNKEYMAVFDPASVLVVGSHVEKEYADAHGYGFCWSYPMRSAIHSKISRRLNFFAIRQINLWVKELSKFDRVIFFIYEDTQPLGVFFVYVGRLLPSIVTSVCIQHGFFLKYYYPIRIDGELSDINFVWGMSQSELISPNKLKIFEIGLPYFARAKPFNELHVILVGTGMEGSGTDIYERAINTYTKIHHALANISRIKTFYRPHPNEYNDEELIVKLNNIFSLVDDPNKLAQLDGPRAIFIGVESSLLFEAGIAGHFVVRLKLDESLPIFHLDFEFKENEASELIQWIRSIANGKIEKPIKSTLFASPHQRFKRALYESGLVN